MFSDIEIDIRQENVRTDVARNDKRGDTARNKTSSGDDKKLKPTVGQKLSNVYPYNLLNEICRNCTFIDDNVKIEQRLKAVIRKKLSKESTEVVNRVYQRGQSLEKIAYEWKCDVRFVTEYMDSAIFKLSFAFENGEFDDIVKR